MLLNRPIYCVIFFIFEILCQDTHDCTLGLGWHFCVKTSQWRCSKMWEPLFSADTRTTGIQKCICQATRCFLQLKLNFPLYIWLWTNIWVSSMDEKLSLTNSIISDTDVLYIFLVPFGHQKLKQFLWKKLVLVICQRFLVTCPQCRNYWCEYWQIIVLKPT